MFKLIGVIMLILGIAGAMYWMAYESGLDEDKLDFEAKIGASSFVAIISGLGLIGGFLITPKKRVSE